MKTDRLANDLASYRYKGPLGQLLREFRLKPVHFQVLAILLQQHLRSEATALEGRAILSAIFENSFEVLSGLELLHANGPLRASGLVVIEDDEECPDDVLEARFRISEDALIAFQGEIAGLVVEDRRDARSGYRHQRDLLVDLRILHNLHRHRSDRVFHQDRWDRIHAGSVLPGSHLTRRIESFAQRILRRLELTPEAASFPAVRLFREFGLELAEQMMVISLLFRELYEGNAYCDAAELVRLVSADELELLRNRRLLRPGSTLVSADFVRIEAVLEGREMTGEVWLSDWVVNALLGSTPPDRGIGRDEQLDWHLYLKNLEDTGSFFRDLDAN